MTNLTHLTINQFILEKSQERLAHWFWSTGKNSAETRLN